MSSKTRTYKNLYQDPEWREEYLQKLGEYQKSEYHCVCGVTITKGARNGHLKSNKHKKKMEEIQFLDNVDKTKLMEELEEIKEQLKKLKKRTARQN